MKLSLAMLLLCGSPAFAEAIVVTAPMRPYAAPRVPDAELRMMRGGLRLPNGLDVRIGIDIQTWVDGRLALHSIYASDGANAGVRVFTDGTDARRTAPGTVGVTVPADDGSPRVLFNRAGTGITVQPGVAGATPTTVNVLAAAPSEWLDANGENLVPVTLNGGAASSESGNVTLTSGDGGAVVTLETPTLKVQQLIGQATGIVIANTANNRMIDTVSSINVDLQGVPAGLLPSALMANRVALEAMTNR